MVRIQYYSTSINIKPEHKEYLIKNNINLSQYVREKLDEDTK